MDLHQICSAQITYDAKICLLQSKPVANAVKAIFATTFAHQCKYGSKYGLYGVCYRFALEQTYYKHIINIYSVLVLGFLLQACHPLIF